MSISSDIRKKERAIDKLQKYRKDLLDDGSDISSINRLVSELQSDFQKFVVSDNTNGIVSKIGTYTEVYQSNDNDLDRAVGYIDSEIAALRREIAALERALEAARAAKEALSGN